MKEEKKKAVSLLIEPDQLKVIEDAKKQPRYNHMPMTVFILEMTMKGIEEDKRQ